MAKGLTPKQQRFVDEYLIDCNATQAAIRAKYTATNADVTGPRLLGNVGVAKAIAARREKVSAKADLTLQSHLDTLNGLRDKAATAEQYSAAVSAEVNRGKASGFYVEQHEHKVKGKVEVVVRITRESRRVTAS